jgi:transposase InsO family protein
MIYSALIELTKIELQFENQLSKVGKNIQIDSLLFSLKISIRTLQRWKSNYKKNGLSGVGIKAIKGREAIEVPDEVKSLINEYRAQFKWGSEVIQAHLLRDHDIEVTRFKIERYLTKSGLREKYPCTTIKKKRALKKKRHTKKVIVKEPGKHTQMDVKYQTHLLKNKEKAYVYNFIDHASNWSFKYAYSRITAANTKDFMSKLLKECPFNIRRLQTDNGVEFTFKWISEYADNPKAHPLMRICHEQNITHKLIPPGEKELQGLVERSHRQDDQELFSNIEPENLTQFNKSLDEYFKFRNERRRFKKLSWLTPNEYLSQEKDEEAEHVTKLVA